jgi:uncharacterized protein (TIGR02996 family)
MSAELLGLLQACRENPDDDTPRLILADWLIDHDDPDRAEFIRLQVERSRLLQDDHVRQGTLPPRERILLAHHRIQWLGPLLAAPDEKHFERGLIRISCRLSAWQVFAPKVSSWDGWDWVQSLQFGHSQRRTVLRDPLLLPPQLTSLAINSFGLGPSGADILAESPDLDRLIVLELGYNQLGPEGAQYLADSPHLARLQHLGLAGNRIGPAGLRALAKSEHLAGLRSLDLSWNELDPASVRLLVGSPTLRGITSLNLASNRLGPPGAEALGGAPSGVRLFGGTLRVHPHLIHRTHLTALDLAENSLGDAGIQALLTGPHLANLRELRLQLNGIGDAGARALADCPHLTRLTHLDLSGNAIGAEGALALARSTTLSPQLRLPLTTTGLPEDVVALLRERFGAGSLSDASGNSPTEP